MEYPKEGEYWFQRCGDVEGPMRASFDGKRLWNVGKCWYSNGKAVGDLSGSYDLVQRAEVTRVGPLINQDETGGQKP